VRNSIILMGWLCWHWTTQQVRRYLSGRNVTLHEQTRRGIIWHRATSGFGALQGKLTATGAKTLPVPEPKAGGIDSTILLWVVPQAEMARTALLFLRAAAAASRRRKQTAHMCADVDAVR
jgi:hypothetical protein